ncbi:MAG: hypothetical protein AAFV26_02165 [Pseudomonadota bacterium]
MLLLRALRHTFAVAVLATLPAAAVTVSAGTVTPAEARELGAADKAAVQKRVDAFTGAMDAKEYVKIASFLPPRVLELISSKSNVSIDKLKASMEKVMQSTMQQVDIKSFSMSVDDADVRAGTGGEPFLLVPTKTVVKAPDGRTVEATSHTLALKDKDVWYLMRVQLQQVQLLAEAYPYLKGVTFPRGSMKVIE